MQKGNRKGQPRRHGRPAAPQPPGRPAGRSIGQSAGQPIGRSAGRSQGRPKPGRGPVWLYGLHAVAAALANPEREVRRVLATPDLLARGLPWLAGVPASEASRAEIEKRLPPGAVHQGIAAEVAPLPGHDIEDVCRAAADVARSAVLVLDMVSDPQNVGAILRSAAAFGAAAVILPGHGAPEATGALAKAASGALETVPLVHVVNLRRALDRLKEAGFWCVGFDGAAETALGETALPAKAALLLGAEGTGLRRLSREACDLLVRIPIAPAIESLNVSAAAAVALYEWARAGS